MAQSSGNAPAWRKGEVIDDRYRVRHLAWDIALAVKRPRPELFRDEENRERFADEAATWVFADELTCTCVDLSESAR